MNSMYQELDGLCERDRKNGQHFINWYWAWCITFAIALVTLGPVEEGISAVPVWHWTLAVLPILPGFMAVRTYRLFISRADELIRGIHVNALATGCGVGLIGGALLGLLGQVIEPFEDSSSFVLIAMLFAFIFKLRSGLAEFQR